MVAHTFWKTVVADRTDFLGRLLDGLKARGIRYCVLGGQASMPTQTQLLPWT
jgi:hypothetical protein